MAGLRNDDMDRWGDDRARDQRSRHHLTEVDRDKYLKRTLALELLDLEAGLSHSRFLGGTARRLWRALRG